MPLCGPEVPFVYVSYIEIYLNLLLGQDTLSIQIILGLLSNLRSMTFLDCRVDSRVNTLSVGGFGHGPMNTHHGVAWFRRDLLR